MPRVTEVIEPAEAGVAVTAGEHGLDRNAIADIHPPAPGDSVPDRGDGAERFVVGRGGHGRAEHAFELLVVAATDSACIDPL